MAYVHTWGEGFKLNKHINKDTVFYFSHKYSSPSKYTFTSPHMWAYAGKEKTMLTQYQITHVENRMLVNDQWPDDEEDP